MNNGGLAGPDGFGELMDEMLLRRNFVDWVVLVAPGHDRPRSHLQRVVDRCRHLIDIEVGAVE